MESKKDLTVEALIQKAKEKKLEITVEDAEKILHSLSDSDLDKVTGGTLHSAIEGSGETCPNCHGDITVLCNNNVYYCFTCDSFFTLESNDDASAANSVGLRPSSIKKGGILY